MKKGYDENIICIIECKNGYFRPAEVDTLKGDFGKAKRLLKWKPQKKFRPNLLKIWSLMS